LCERTAKIKKAVLQVYFKGNHRRDAHKLRGWPQRGTRFPPSYEERPALQGNINPVSLLFARGYWSREASLPFS
jgi:hypothetical protein